MRFLLRAGGGPSYDPHDLDRGSDGIACESSRLPPNGIRIGDKSDLPEGGWPQQDT